MARSDRKVANRKIAIVAVALLVALAGCSEMTGGDNPEEPGEYTVAVGLNGQQTSDATVTIE